MDNDDVQRSFLPLERPLVDLDLDVLGLEHVWGRVSHFLLLKTERLLIE